MSDKQIQKAGSGSKQIQAETYIQNVGIDEARVCEIVDQRCENVLMACISESQLIAEKRVSEFKSELLTAFANKPETMDALREPACVDSLELAAKSATRSDAHRDKELLSQLVIRRFEHPNDRHVATGVNRAIEVVDLLTDDELLGLTVYYAVNKYLPVSGVVSEGLMVLDNLFGKLITGDLPSGQNWIENLDIHDALRFSQFSTLKPLADYYAEVLSGYTSKGIEVGSEDEASAIQYLLAAKLPVNILVAHELNPGYQRLNVRDIKDFSQIKLVTNEGGETVESMLSSEQTEALRAIAEMNNYCQFDETVKSNFIDMFDGFSHLSHVAGWWNSIPTAPRITVVGNALANANARRIDPELPDLEQ